MFICLWIHANVSVHVCMRVSSIKLTHVDVLHVCACVWRPVWLNWPCSQVFGLQWYCLNLYEYRKYVLLGGCQRRWGYGMGGIGQLHRGSGVVDLRWRQRSTLHHICACRTQLLSQCCDNDNSVTMMLVLILCGNVGSMLLRWSCNTTCAWFHCVDGEVEALQDKFVYEWIDTPEGNKELENVLEKSVSLRFAA